MERDAAQGAGHRALPWFSSSQATAEHVASALQDSTGVAEDRRAVAGQRTRHQIVFEPSRLCRI